MYADGDLLALDRATLTAAVPSGCSLAGVRTHYSDVASADGTPPSARPAVVTLHALASLSASTLVCAGRADTTVAGVPDTPLAVTLADSGEGYRIAAQRTG